MKPIETDGPKSSRITDHPFVPRGAWYTTCGHLMPYGATNMNRHPCGLAEAAHTETTLTEEDRR